MNDDSKYRVSVPFFYEVSHTHIHTLFPSYEETLVALVLNESMFRLILVLLAPFFAFFTWKETDMASLQSVVSCP